MAYCDIDDLKAKISEDDLISLTDDDNAGEINTDVTDKAVAAAEALINSYCGTRYTVPFDPVPEMVNALAVDIAVYKLFSRRGRAGDNIRHEYNDAVALLKDVSAKRADIDGAVSAGTEKPSHPVTITTSDRIFSRTKMEGF